MRPKPNFSRRLKRNLRRGFRRSRKKRLRFAKFFLAFARLGFFLVSMKMQVMLVFCGLVFGWFSFGGLSDLMPIQWAAPLAIMITALFSAACCAVGTATNGWHRLGYGCLAVLMWASVACSDGINFNELVSRDGGDRMRTSTTGATARFSEEALQSAALQLADLTERADRVLAEAARAEAAATPAVLAVLQQNLAAELKTGSGPRSRAIEAQMADATHRATEAAGLRAQHGAMAGRIAAAEAEVARQQAGVTAALATAAVSVDTQHFIFNLASAQMGRDRDMTSAFLAAIGAVFFGALELVYGVFCAVAAAGRRKPAAEAKISTTKTVTGEETVPDNVWPFEVPDPGAPGETQREFQLTAADPAQIGAKASRFETQERMAAVVGWINEGHRHTELVNLAIGKFNMHPRCARDLVRRVNLQLAAIKVAVAA